MLRFFFGLAPRYWGCPEDLLLMPLLFALYIALIPSPVIRLMDTYCFTPRTEVDYFRIEPRSLLSIREKRIGRRLRLAVCPPAFGRAKIEGRGWESCPRRRKLGNFINHYGDVRKRIAATQMCEHACASGERGEIHVGRFLICSKR